MELSGLIFVALAVAWAAYLIPKALQHHDEVARSRSVDRFSHRMRVLARRETVNGRNARLVVSSARATAPPEVTTQGPEPTRARRAAIAQATRRRRRVLGAILLVNAVVVALAAFSVVTWWWVAAPVALLAAWLVACRLMVRTERGIARPRASADPAPEASHPVPPGPEGERTSYADGDSPLEDTMATGPLLDEPADPNSWDPLPVTLPTYVSAPTAARRTVRTIDLDSTGVWSSGRSDIDSALARGAEDAERAERQRRRDEGNGRRAVGS